MHICLDACTHWFVQATSIFVSTVTQALSIDVCVALIMCQKGKFQDEEDDLGPIYFVFFF